MNSAFTAKAAAAIQKNYTMYSWAQLLQGGFALPNSQMLLDESQAEVRVDGTAIVRRQFSMTLANPMAYLPLSATSVLSPFLTEIQVFSGVIYSDGTSESWPIFTGAIEDPTVNDDDMRVDLKITASDRAQNISERRLPQPYTIAAGVQVPTAIQTLLNSVRPGLTYRVVNSPGTVPVTPAVVIDELEDPMDHANQLATAGGYEVYFDGSGTCVIQPIPDPTSQVAVWSFAEGATAMLKTVSQVMTAKSSYSHAVAKSNTVDGVAPIRADVYDLVPTSPTYFDPSVPSASRFGDKPVELVSDLITSSAQAVSAATGLLARKKGAVQNISFTSAPVTALDEHDLIGLSRARLGMNALPLTLESFTIPCTPGGEMNPTCRSRSI